jgi:sec-independent protein translocase protein TatB
MFGHLPEFIIVLVIALIVFGPEKLPEVAATAGRMVREAREMIDVSLNPRDVEVPDDFSSYYYESMARAGEEPPVAEGEDYWQESEPEFAEIEPYDEDFAPELEETEDTHPHPV